MPTDDLEARARACAKEVLGLLIVRSGLETYALRHVDKATTAILAIARQVAGEAATEQRRSDLEQLSEMASKNAVLASEVVRMQRLTGDPARTYVTQGMSAEVMSMLIDAVYPGLPDVPAGQPNTLWALANAARERIAELELRSLPLPSTGTTSAVCDRCKRPKYSACGVNFVDRYCLGINCAPSTGEAVPVELGQVATGCVDCGGTDHVSATCAATMSATQLDDDNRSRWYNQGWRDAEKHYRPGVGVVPATPAAPQVEGVGTCEPAKALGPGWVVDPSGVQRFKTANGVAVVATGGCWDAYIDGKMVAHGKGESTEDGARQALARIQPAAPTAVQAELPTIPCRGCRGPIPSVQASAYCDSCRAKRAAQQPAVRQGGGCGEMVLDLVRCGQRLEPYGGIVMCGKCDHSTGRDGEGAKR